MANFPSPFIIFNLPVSHGGQQKRLLTRAFRWWQQRRRRQRRRRRRRFIEEVDFGVKRRKQSKAFQAQLYFRRIQFSTTSQNLKWEGQLLILSLIMRWSTIDIVVSNGHEPKMEWLIIDIVNGNGHDSSKMRWSIIDIDIDNLI